MTLPEVLISMLVIGLIATAVSMAIVVSYRAQPSATGRLNVARAEQNIALFMPADLSSAVQATSDPADSPCTAPPCAGVTGSSALQVEWPENGGTTTVSYVYRPSPGGDDLYQLVRVECFNGANCEQIVVLRELDGPPHASFVAGVTPVPTSVIDVTKPLLPAADEAASANYDTSSNANRIVVTVNGGGTTDGAGGGINRISITAGGTELRPLAAATVTGPSFLQARSKCGGPITLIVDESSSIDAAELGNVRTAVKAFVSELAGTPTQVQVVRFSSRADVLGLPGWDALPGATKAAPDWYTHWNKYYDMASDADVASLLTAADSLTSGGATNWEDALFRTFYSPTGVALNQDGIVQTVLPELVVFFTDGVPTVDRTLVRSGEDYREGDLPADPPVQGSPWPDPTSNKLYYSQVSWNRADYIADRFRDVSRIIGVGVGSDLNGQSYVYETPGAGVRYRNASGSQVSQRKSGSSWVNTTPNVDNTKILGNIVAGGQPYQPGVTWIESEYVGSAWTNTDTADVFLSPNWSQFASALKTIAVGECGGTLTVQTDLGGSPAPANVTYETGGKVVTTSLASRAAAFDIDTGTMASIDAELRVQGLDQAGYVADSWSCKLRGLPLDPGRWSLTGATAAEGITVDVGANEAIACTLKVTN